MRFADKIVFFSWYITFLRPVLLLDDDHIENEVDAMETENNMAGYL